MLSWEQVGAAAMLSRATAGTFRGSVVISTPGSPKAVAARVGEADRARATAPRLGAGSVAVARTRSGDADRRSELGGERVVGVADLHGERPPNGAFPTTSIEAPGAIAISVR